MFDPFSVPVSHPYVVAAFALSALLVCRIVLHLMLEYILKNEHEPRLPQSAGTLRAYRYFWAPRAQRFGVSPSLTRIGFAGYPRPLPTSFCCSRGGAESCTFAAAFCVFHPLVGASTGRRLQAHHPSLAPRLSLRSILFLAGGASLPSSSLNRAQDKVRAGSVRRFNGRSTG
ncbi:hypothetical protein K438DRAFT_1996375 [Mycena galopus ATCC 62051]|nr:hypothetical protein K438DRAFT_1996375 [Mycena galopus ATCC 62051]